MLFNYIQLDDLITILNEQNESCIQNQKITALGKKEKRKINLLSFCAQVLHKFVERKKKWKCSCKQQSSPPPIRIARSIFPCKFKHMQRVKIHKLRINHKNQFYGQSLEPRQLTKEEEIVRGLARNSTVEREDRCDLAGNLNLNLGARRGDEQ